LEVQTRKPKQSTWEYGEVLVLMKAKHDQDYCGKKEEDFSICHGCKIFTTYKKLPYMQRQMRRNHMRFQKYY
jgi:hypothetical protein